MLSHLQNTDIQYIKKSAVKLFDLTENYIDPNFASDFNHKTNQNEKNNYSHVAYAYNRKYIKFDFQRVWQDRSYSNDETEHKIRDIRQKFQRAGYIVLANYIPHDVTDSCYGDKINHILINYNGDVFGCTARDFTIENRIGQLDSKGVIHFNNELVDKRNNLKLSKSVCQNCRIAPLCGGGCKQRAIEDNYDDRCTMEYSESDMDRIILDIFKHSFNLKDS